MNRASREFLLEFGNRVRQLRKEAGFSQEELAAVCGLHRTYIGSVERGERNVTLVTIAVIASALEVEPASLVPPASSFVLEDTP
jgi:transcriptional regulator with XRE-family HTH domain